MDNKIKKKVSIFVGLAVLMTALAASNLSKVELKPGMPLPSLGEGRLILAKTPQSPPIDLRFNSFLLTLLGIVLAVFTLVTLYRLVMGTDLKRLMTGLRKFVLGTMGAFLFLALVLLLLPGVNAPMDEPLIIPTPQPASTTPLGSPPDILLWLVGAGLAVLTAFLVISVLNSWRQPDQAARLAFEVEKAQQNLLAGLDLKEVILRCYQKMSQILQEEGGVARQSFMTPAEFERMLSAEGFPQAPVHRLTYLFENARYGNWTPNPWDDQNALDSLQAIIAHVREKKARGEDE